MGVDDLLFLIIIGGMLLTIAYLRDQYAARRRYRIAQRRAEQRLRELYRRPVAIIQPHEASDPGICQILQDLKLSLESPITRR